MLDLLIILDKETLFEKNFASKVLKFLPYYHLIFELDSFLRTSVNFSSQLL